MKSLNARGYLSAVVLEESDGRRSVALRLGSELDAITTIPSSIDNAQALSTMLNSLTVHIASRAGLEGIGGSNSTLLNGPNHVVILGSNARAVECAQACAALGSNVTMVCLADPQKVRRQLGPAFRSINVMLPAVGELELGFCTVLGQFDAMIDTLGDEYDDIVYNDNDNEEDDEESLRPRSGSTSVLRLLQSRHACRCYLSTQSHAQRMVGEQGVLWGPAKANEYVKKMAAVRQASTDFVPPDGLASTVGTLLQAGVILGDAKRKDPVLVHGWSLADVWESTTWPRDTSGGANVRFGLPVVNDIDIEERMVSAPPSMARPVSNEDEPEEEETGEHSYILDLVGAGGLLQHVIAPERDCVLFLSAKFCRTCRYLSPAYQRLARLETEEHASSIVIARADTGGPLGKELGRKLGVDAVPTFLLFRQGRRFGRPLGITRLPSKKLSAAMELLRSGQEWDDQYVKQAEAAQKKS